MNVNVKIGNLIVTVHLQQNSLGIKTGIFFCTKEVHSIVTTKDYVMLLKIVTLTHLKAILDKCASQMDRPFVEFGLRIKQMSGKVQLYGGVRYKIGIAKKPEQCLCNISDEIKRPSSSEVSSEFL